MTKDLLALDVVSPSLKAIALTAFVNLSLTKKTVEAIAINKINVSMQNYVNDAANTSSSSQ